VVPGSTAVGSPDEGDGSSCARKRSVGGGFFRRAGSGGAGGDPVVTGGTDGPSTSRDISDVITADRDLAVGVFPRSGCPVASGGDCSPAGPEATGGGDLPVEPTSDLLRRYRSLTVRKNVDDNDGRSGKLPDLVGSSAFFNERPLPVSCLKLKPEVGDVGCGSLSMT